MKLHLQVNDMHIQNQPLRRLLSNVTLNTVERLNEKASTANRGETKSVRQDTMKLEYTFIVSPDANYINDFARLYV